LASIVSRGHRLHWGKLGQGEPPVLLLPGLLQASPDWERTGVAPALAKEHRVLLFDPLGHGLSDRPAEASTYAERPLVDDVVAVLDAAGVERAVLWGWSRGARLAYLTATFHPERVAGIVAGGQPIRAAAETRDRLGRLARALAEEPDKFFDEVGVSSAASRAYVLANNDLAAIVASLQGMADHPEEVDLAGLDVPILLYCGSADPATADVLRTAERLAAQVAIIDGLDHGAMFVAGRRLLPKVEELLRAAVADGRRAG
jgi:pimeloyl-ACP methyl ester carboxylesterase